MDDKSHASRTCAVPLPFRRGLNRVEAAGYIGLSPTGFDRLVREKQMPRPKHVGGRRIWDLRALDLAFDALDVRNADANPWD